MKKQFFVKLNPPRPTFAMDMTPEERGFMQEHLAYWQGYIESGMAIVVGLVLDPKGAHGVGIVSVEDESELNTILANDPALKTGSQYEFFPMMANFKK